MPDRVLVIRNDKLGDFMLAWPAFALLKQQYPEATIVALVPQYTSPLAELCPSIDEVMIDDHSKSAIKDITELARQLKNARIDASISLFSETRTALALWLARVPWRFGPATKIAQLFLNNRLLQKRSRSAKPEFEYNINLVQYFIQCNNDEPGALPGPPYLSFNPVEISRQKQTFYQQHAIDDARRLVFIHPGTGGSAINLSLQQYADLAATLAAVNTLHFVITAGPDELETAEKLSKLMAGTEHSTYHSTQGLVSFCRFIAMSDLFISGSTGPLHIAGALNVPTAAFYPARRSAKALRWQTLNQADRRLAFSPVKYTGDDDMKTIDIGACVQQIDKLLHQTRCTNT
jgi:ADP-heptose:LPS heptosyltransferase